MAREEDDRPRGLAHMEPWIAESLTNIVTTRCPVCRLQRLIRGSRASFFVKSILFITDYLLQKIVIKN